VTARRKPGASGYDRTWIERQAPVFDPSKACIAIDETSVQAYDHVSAIALEAVEPTCGHCGLPLVRGTCRKADFNAACAEANDVTRGAT
jgi:hypothetical protein